MKGVLTPTTKLQTPFCMPLNLYQSKYSQLLSFLTPQMYSYRSERLRSSKTILIPIILGCSCVESRMRPNLRSWTVPQTQSPKSIPVSEAVSSSSIGGRSASGLSLRGGFGEFRGRFGLVSRSGQFIRQSYKVQGGYGGLLIDLNMSKYTSRMDPLDLLRLAYTEGKAVRLKDKQLLFEKDVRVPLGQPTAWVSPLTKKQYTVGSLWLYLQFRMGRVTNYLQKISEYGVDNVTISDRTEIENYFLGKTSESQCINQEIKLQLSTKNVNKTREQPAGGFDDQADPAKKIKTETLSPELQVIEFISKFQRPTSSKTRSLRSANKSFQGLLKVLQSSGGEEAAKIEEKKMRINTILERKKCPIIIVPEHYQLGNVSLANIEKFLVNGEYIENPPPMHEHQRKIEMECTLRGKRVLFDVTNNPSLLTPTDWNNVVAIFVQGRKNEFQNWFYRDPVEVFKRAKGFLLKFPTKEQTEGHQWNIKVFTLDRNVRYRDSGVQKAIWNEIESFLYEKI